MVNFIDWLISCRNQLLYLSILLSVPSLLLYIAEIVVIIRNSEFHNAFFALFVARAIPNIVYTLNSYYSWRLTILFGNIFHPLYVHLPEWVLLLAPFNTTLCYQAENFASAFLLVNRLTAIKWPHSHQKLWKWLLPICLLAIYVYPCYHAADNFHLGAVVQLENPNSTSLNFFLHIGLNPGDLDKMYRSNAIFSLVFFAMCSLINIGTVIAYRQHKRRMANSLVTEVSNLNALIERNLLLYAFLTFAANILIATIQISVYVFYVGGNMRIYMLVLSQLPWIMDMATLVLPSWLILWASAQMRSKLGCRRLGRIVPIPQQTNNDTSTV